jgi:DNA (cytosine-5)-methyltransferase 1
MFTLTTNDVHAVAIRGREGGATAELGGEQANALRASGGGGSDPYVLAPTALMPYRNLLKNGEVESGFATRDVCDALHTGSGHGNKAPLLAVCVTGDITHTLKGEGFDGSEDGTGRGQQIVVHGTQDPGTSDIAYALGRNSGQENVMHYEMAVRRLLPVECERLQGFPDGWTDVPTGHKQTPAADGPRYKQLGNSWAVTCVRWQGMRIAKWLAENERPKVLSSGGAENLLVWALAA